jgi:hypothetical protein
MLPELPVEELPEPLAIPDEPLAVPVPVLSPDVLPVPPEALPVELPELGGPRYGGLSPLLPHPTMGAHANAVRTSSS